MVDERLPRRPTQEDRRGRREEGDAKAREATRAFDVGFPTVKRCVAAYREGNLLAPKKRPGSKPDEGARKLLEIDLEELPDATLPQRREFFGCAWWRSDNLSARKGGRGEEIVQSLG